MLVAQGELKAQFRRDPSLQFGVFGFGLFQVVQFPAKSVVCFRQACMTYSVAPC